MFDAAMVDKAKVAAQRLKTSLHSLQTQNKLLHYENNGLTHALEAKKNHKKKSKTMDIQRHKEHYGSAVFWSPRKLHKACTCEATKQDEDERRQLQEKLKIES
jgi:hypothetical protein